MLDVEKEPEGLTKWERIALERCIGEGPQYASSGSSAIFDAMMELCRQGMAKEDYSKGVTYVRATQLGLQHWAWDMHRRPPKVAEVMVLYLDEAGIPRAEFESCTVPELALAVGRARGEIVVQKRKKKAVRS